jgi:hypothetical protein
LDRDAAIFITMALSIKIYTMNLRKLFFGDAIGLEED